MKPSNDTHTHTPIKLSDYQNKIHEMVAACDQIRVTENIHGTRVVRFRKEHSPIFQCYYYLYRIYEAKIKARKE